MFISPSPFARQLQLNLRSKNHSPESDDFSHDIEEEIETLRKRLKSLRKGREKLPLTNNLVSFEDQEALVQNQHKREKYGLKCPDCHKQYQFNSRIGNALTIFRDAQNKIDKTL